MRLALIELRRRPGRFAVVGGALTLLVLLMLFLGWLLDGLFLGSTGAIRVQDADAFVFSDDARQSLLRSSLDQDELDLIAGIDGVREVSGVGLSLLGAEIPGEEEPANVAVGGYQLATAELPEPPPAGAAYADRRLERFGAELGQTLLIGPAKIPLRIVGWVDDANFLLQGGLWVGEETWRVVQNANRPDAVVADDEFQVAAVTIDGSVGDIGARIDEALGRSETLSENDAVFAIPGVPEQNATIGAVIYATAFVVALVVGLFFALLTLERAGVYALLKAIGTRDRTIVVGLLVQAVVVALGAFVIGGAAGLLLSATVPPEVPVVITTGRAVFVLVAVLVAAVVGSLASLRRVVRIDPAAAIGAGL